MRSKEVEEKIKNENELLLTMVNEGEITHMGITIDQTLRLRVLEYMYAIFLRN